MRRKAAVAMLPTAFDLAAAAPVWADAPPPPNGGNAAGQSGQGTVNPDDRPGPARAKAGRGASRNGFGLRERGALRQAPRYSSSRASCATRPAMSSRIARTSSSGRPFGSGRSHET